MSLTTAQLDAATRDPVCVREMFDRIASRYDFANHLLSAGFDYGWRTRAADIVASWNPSRVLDVATGTGDLALVMQRRLPAVDIVGSDFSSEMLAIANRKGVPKTVIADATALPFEDQSFDVVTIAFGLRNMADRAAVLRQFSRVLRAHGHLLVLDFSMPHGRIRGLYRWYLHHILPRFAGALTGARAAYDYLAESIETFPDGDAMCEFITANGFADASFEPLTSGVVTIYTAQRA